MSLINACVRETRVSKTKKSCFWFAAMLAQRRRRRELFFSSRRRRDGHVRTLGARSEMSLYSSSRARG